MTFNVWTFLLEVINFLVLAFVLHRLLYRPLRAAVDRRRSEHEAVQAAAEAARRDAEELKRQVAAELADVESHRLELLERARTEADAHRTHLTAEAEQVVQRRLADAQRTSEQEHRDMLGALQDDVILAARTLTERLLRESVDVSLHEQLAIRLIESLETAVRDKRDRWNAADDSRDGAVLETARELDPNTRARLEAAIRSLSTAQVPIDYRISPDLIGGVRVRLGGTVWDASLTGQLEQITHR